MEAVRPRAEDVVGEGFRLFRRKRADVLRALGPAGTYTVEYQIVSTDGHPVHGESRFTLTVSGSGTPAGYSAGSSPPPPAAEMPVWPWIVGAGALLLLGLALARRLAGRTKSVPARGAD